MSNINIQLNEAQAKLQALHDDHRIYEGLQSLFKGNIVPGNQQTIELVAVAIRGNFSVPLKYTQSYASLKALYAYAQEKNDAMLCEWTERQITQVLGPNVLISIRNELQSKIKTVENFTLRKQFIENYRSMTINDLSSFTSKLSAGSFWGKNLKRIIRANAIREELTGSSDIPAIRTVSDLLKVSFYNEQTIKSGTDGHPEKIIKDSGVSPYVYIPSLIELYAPSRNIQAIFLSPFLKNGLIFKKFAIPNDVFEKLLKKNKFEESDYRELMTK